MPTYLITAHQEMFAQLYLDAPTEESARALFLERIAGDKAAWQLGDEDCDIDEIIMVELSASCEPSEGN